MRNRFGRAVLGAAFGLAMLIGGPELGTKPAMAQATTGGGAPEGFEWGYNKGFFFRNPNFELKISTRTQFRYTYRMLDTDATDRDNGAFNIPRARFRLDGYAWHPWFKYKLQYDFVGARDLCPTGGVGCDALLQRSDLRDLYFDVTKQPWYQVRMGQFKQPFGQQELTSSGDQQFVDRSIASTVFAPSREVGTMLYGLSFEKVFGYEVAVSNGNGRNHNADNNSGYRWSARIHWDPNGEYKLSESAVDHPQQVNYTLALAANHNNIEANLAETTELLGQGTAEAFFGLKWKNLSVSADYYKRREELPTTDIKSPSSGYIGQVGYFLTQKIELALRYSGVGRTLDNLETNGTEQRIGFNWFFEKHDLKFQADYGRTRFDGDAGLISASGATTGILDAFRAQLQVVF
jgi:phosphate-selective porin